MTGSDGTNAAHPADLPTRVAAVLASFDLDELDAVLAEEGAVAALDEADAIRQAAVWCHEVGWGDDGRSLEARAEFVRRLIRAGLDLNQASVSPSPLEAVISMVPAPSNLDLVREMIAAGADPNVRSPTSRINRRSALDEAVTDSEMWALLEPHANAEGLCGALVALIEHASDPVFYARFREILARLPSIDVAVPGILPPLHAAALSGNVELLRDVLRYAGDHDLALVEHHEIWVPSTAPPGGGVTATIELAVGMTPLDAVESAQSLLNWKIAQFRAADSDYAHETRTRHLEGLSACHEELVRAGARSSGIAPPDADGKSSQALIDWTFTELVCNEPYAYLIAGRGVEGRFSERDIAELRARVTEVASEIGQPLVLIEATDPACIGSMGYIGACVLGIPVASADACEFTAVSPADLAAELARAHALPWDLISEQVLRDRDDLRLSETGMYATARGPLAGVWVAYGVLAALREEDAGWDSSVDEEQDFRNDPASPAATVAGLDLVRGNTESQEPQPEAVYGVEVERALWDENPPVSVDVSDAAHKDRVARLGPLAAQSSYYLVAHYD